MLENALNREGDNEEVCTIGVESCMIDRGAVGIVSEMSHNTLDCNLLWTFLKEKIINIHVSNTLF